MGERRRGRGDRPAKGLTTRGRCLLAGGVAAVACAFVLDERDLLRVGVVAMALPLLAALVTVVRPVRLTAQRQVTPDRLHPGAQGQVRLTLINGGGRTPTLDITEPGAPGLTDGLHGLVSPIKRDRGTHLRYPIRAGQRGRFVIGSPQLRIHDPFELWEEHRSLPAHTEVLVVPAVVPLTGMPPSSGARSAASGRAAVGTTGGDPDVGVRPYRPGDDIRTIHWRASARQDDLVVRLEEPVSHGGATVYLDHRESAHRGQGAASSLETAIVLAASICLHLLSADHQVRLVTQHGTVLAEGHDIADEVLADLAELTADESPTVRRPAVGRSGLFVAVVGEMTQADAALLALARNRSVHAVALVLQTSDWAGGPSSLPMAATVLGAAGWRVVVVRAGQNLATAWRQACSVGDQRLAASRG